MLGKIEGRRGRERQRIRWGWMASLTQWTWIWANSGRLWGTRKDWRAAVHGVTKSMTWLSGCTTTRAGKTLWRLTAEERWRKQIQSPNDLPQAKKAVCGTEWPKNLMEMGLVLSLHYHCASKLVGTHWIKINFQYKYLCPMERKIFDSCLPHLSNPLHSGMKLRADSQGYIFF